MTNADDFMMPDSLPGDPPPMDAAPIPEGRSNRKELPAPNLDAGLPANIDAEKTILGAILLDNAAFNDAAETIEPDDFSLDSHRRIFLRMAQIIDEGGAVDIVTLSNRLAMEKEIEAIGGVAYLAGLTEGLPLRPVISQYIHIVKDKARLRRIMHICSEAIARASDQSESAMEVLSSAEVSFLEIAQEAVASNLRTMEDSVRDAGGLEKYITPMIDSTKELGIPSGYYDLDEMTGGLHKGELIVIAARPSMGKSALGLNIAENVAIDSGQVVAFFSLEMSRQSLEKRLLSSRARVDSKKFGRGGHFSERDRERMIGSLDQFVESSLFIDDSSTLTPVQVRAKARRLKQKMGRLDLVVVDYLQLMTPGKKAENRRVEVGICSKALKAMSKELEVPVIALAQVARSSEQRSDKRPTLSDLRESGDIEQDADVVHFIHRESYYNRDEEQSEEERAMAEIICAKQRNGPTGITRLLYISPFTRFENMARQ